MRQSVEKSDRPDRLRNLSLSPLTSALINVFKQVASLKRLYSQAPSPKAPPSVPEPGRIVFESLEPRILLSADLTPVAPLGSMVEQAQRSGQLDGNVQSVDYHYSLDAGQRVSLAFTTPEPDLQGRLELLATDGSTVLGSANPTGSGNSLVLQDVKLEISGDYTVRVSRLEGSGGFQVQLVLNAGLEDEAFGGASNNSRQTAQELDSSAIALTATADRLAAIGDVEKGNADWYRFSLSAGQSASVALTLTQDFERGSTVGLDLYAADGTPLASGSGDTQRVTRYIHDVVSASGGDFYLRVYDSSDYFNEAYSLLVTRGADISVLHAIHSSQDISRSGVVLGFLGHAVAPISSDGEPDDDTASANNLDGSFRSIGEGDYRAQIDGTLGEGDQDYFKLTLQPGDILAVDLDGGGGTYPQVRLRDQYGRLLTSSHDDSGNGNTRIDYSDFAYQGVYYLVLKFRHSRLPAAAAGIPAPKKFSKKCKKGLT